VIRAVVFDLDGTLIDSAADLAHAVNHALRGLGLPERPPAEIAGFVGEGARRLVERAVAPRAELVEPGLALWWEHYLEHLLDHTVLYPGIAALLRASSLPMAVHTNKPGALARRILAGLGVQGCFREVLGGDEAPRKPDPAGTRAILERLAVAPSQAVYVGDSAIDVQLALAVPMPCLTVTWGLVAEDRLAAAGATRLVRSVDELGSLLRG
jgi:phosphoglycolate phosphatase